jgi:predicted dehydrogenase
MLKIAQIGVGYWGPNLLRNLVLNRRCKIKTVVDLSSERRNYVMGLYPSIGVTDDVGEVLDDPEIDGVVIATPVSTHFDLAVRALAAGKHILVEKPLATNVAEVEEIEKLSKKKNLLVMAGHTFLFSPAVRYVKQLIETGDLGDVRYIYSQRLNLGRIRSDVDALWNFAPHDVSIIQYWLGDPRPVSVVRRGLACVQKGIEDVVFMNILYPNDVMANIHVSWLDPRRARLMAVIASKRMLVYDDTADSKLAIYDKGIRRRVRLGKNRDGEEAYCEEFDHRCGDVLLPKIDSTEPLSLEINHFLDCIENGTKCLTGVEHAKAVVEILSAGNLDGWQLAITKSRDGQSDLL